MLGDLRLAERDDCIVGRPVEILAQHRREIFEPPRLIGRRQFPRADSGLPSANRYADLQVDAIPDAVLLPHHVILDSSGTKVCAQSFKKGPLNRHMGIKHVGEGNYRVSGSYDLKDASVIDGTVYYLDCEFPDVYGHNLLEVWPATWALTHLNRDDLYFATSIRLRPYVLEALKVLGVPEKRIVTITGPTRCELLLVPSPAVVARRFVHPVNSDIFGKIAQLAHGSTLRARARPGPKIYLSRSRISDRSLQNEREVERLVQSFGFTVVHTQEHSLPDQLRILAEATHIVGPGGSGMHNAVFSPRGTKVLILGSTTWFTVIDIFLSQRRYELNYLFGNPLDESLIGQRAKAPWSLDAETLRRALAKFVS